MGATNNRGVYMYDESDTFAKASDLLNQQANALNAKKNIDGGQITLTLPGGGEIVQVTVPHSLGVNPVSMWVHPRNPLSQQDGIDLRVYAGNASSIVIEARTRGSSTLSQLCAWGVIG